MGILNNFADFDVEEEKARLAALVVEMNEGDDEDEEEAK